MSSGADAPAPLQFASTVIYVEDLERSLAFCRDGLGLSVRFLHPSGQYAELETGTTVLALTQDELARTALPDLAGGYRLNRSDRQPAGIDLAFATTDPDRASASPLPRAPRPSSP